MGAKELPKVYSKETSKIKNKRFRSLGQSDLADMLVDSGAAYVQNNDKMIYSNHGQYIKYNY